MHWHAEETLRLDVRTGPEAWMRLRKLTLRAYTAADGYARHEPFIAVAQADLFLEEGRAFIHAAMTRDGAPLGRPAWRSLGLLLKTAHGMRVVVADRHGKPVEFPERLAAEA